MKKEFLKKTDHEDIEQLDIFGKDKSDTISSRDDYEYLDKELLDFKRKSFLTWKDF